MNILLIAGHGAGDPGAIGKVNGKTYKEADLTRQVVSGLQSYLKAYANVTVYPTGNNAYDDQQLGKYLTTGNVKNQDYVLEVHFNASAADAGNGKVKGAEAYVTTSEAGITVEEAILKKLAALGYTNRGVKRKNWSVINATKRAGVSSCLLEVCFIDDGDDMALYEKTKGKAMEAIGQGILEGFGLTKTTAQTGNPSVQKETMTPEKAIEILRQKGIIDTPDYWLAHYGELKYLDILFTKLGEYLK